MRESKSRMSKVPIWGIVVWVIAGAVLGLLWSLWWATPLDKLVAGNYGRLPPFPDMRLGPEFLSWRVTFLAGAAGALLLSTWVLHRQSWRAGLFWLGATSLLTVGLIGLVVFFLKDLSLVRLAGILLHNEVYLGPRWQKPLLLTASAAPTVAWALAAVVAEARSGHPRLGFAVAGGSVSLLLGLLLLTLWVTSCQRPWSWKPQANLRGCNLAGANMSGRDLTGANLYGTTLWGANLTGANLEKADLTKASYDESTRFTEGFDRDGRGMRLVEGKPEGR